MNGSEVVASILKREGVEYLIGFPHSEIFDSAAALGIRPIITRTERVAVNIADGYSRMSAGRKFGVVTVQYGPGSEAGFAAVAQAFGDNTPILYLPTGHPRGVPSVSPNFGAVRNFREVTKYCEAADPIWRIPQMMQHAFSLLRNGGPGPVLLELPTDVLAETFPSDSYEYHSPTASRPQAAPAEIEALADLLLSAARPVIYAGQGVLYAGATIELVALAEALGIPVVTTLNGKSAFPEDHPLALGAGGKSRAKTVDHFLAAADLVLGIGTSFTRSFYITSVPAGKKLAQVTIDPDDLGKDYPIALGVVGDARAVLQQLLDAVGLRKAKSAGRAKMEEEVRAVRDAFFAEWMPFLTSDEEPISPYRVVNDLMQVLDRTKAVVTHDAGHPRDQILPFYVAPVPHGYLGWGKSTQLGTGLGLAIGAKLARPDFTAVNIMGEAAFGMVGMDFETSVRCELPILTIVMRNGIMGGYGGYLPLATARYGIDRLGGNYADIGKALGGYAERVEKVADLQAAMRRCLAANHEGKAALLEVITREEKRIPGFT